MSTDGLVREGVPAGVQRRPQAPVCEVFVLDAVLLRGAPYPEPDRLAVVVTATARVPITIRVNSGLLRSCRRAKRASDHSAISTCWHA